MISKKKENFEYKSDHYEKIQFLETLDITKIYSRSEL